VPHLVIEDDWDEPLAEHVVKEFMKETRALCQRAGRCGYEEVSGHSQGEFHGQTCDEACS